VHDSVKDGWSCEDTRREQFGIVRGAQQPGGFGKWASLRLKINLLGHFRLRIKVGQNVRWRPKN
jgi:hypothetical protein